MKLAQFIYIINGLNPIDFEINLTISKEKVAISRFIFLNYFSVSDHIEMYEKSCTGLCPKTPQNV